MRLPGSAPKAEPVWEAMASELNPRGEPYRWNDLTFPPGEWIEIPVALVERLPFLGWAEVREKAAPDA